MQFYFAKCNKFKEQQKLNKTLIIISKATDNYKHLMW